MKTKLKIIVLLLVFANTALAQDILNKYIEISAENNPALKGKFNEYMASMEVVTQVGTLPDPQLVFGYFINPVETRNGPQQAKISLTQMFPWFGTLNIKEDVAIDMAKAKYEAFEDAKSNLFFEVKSSYFDLYFIERGIEVTSNSIRILETFKNLALIKIEAGTGSGVDEIRAEMELADLENNLMLLKNKWFAHSVKFNNLLNIDENSRIEIPYTLWTDDLADSRQAVLDSLKLNNHQVLNLDYIINSFQSKEKLAKKNGLPGISIGIDYIAIGTTDNAIINTSQNGNDAILFPKIGITIPLYRKKYTAMVKEAIFMQQATENKKTDKINTLESVFEKAYSEYLDADRRIVLFQKQLQLAEKAISILESEYATNAKNFEEILRMEKRVLKYSLELEKARADKQASIAFINYLIGN
ncbi:MAG: TolC family protein [Bacteroidetes bacterium]|nr:TolC family protein [Bacteroidota bacterium]